MYKAGISFHEFGKLNMKQIRYISKAYAEKQQEDFKIADLNAYIQGIYMMDALKCTVGNMFGGKKANFSYPEKAYSIASEEEQLSEDEIQRQRDQFIAALKTMEKNFNRDKEKKNKQKGGAS